ncbi:MAG TPA: M48 family metallopeptidase, partial [Paludibacter sp.]|nr:M48 family metallopeptidase [Paludibacter sp.]
RIANAVEEYLNTHGKSAEVAKYAWEFNLVKDPAVNAFCMPGGKVVVYDGILPVTRDEKGLAVVLGHEIAHAVANHSNERMSQQMGLQYGAALTDMLLQNQKATTRTAINMVYGAGAQFGVILPYSRQHEYEADHLGLIFIAMAGYDPSESIAFWERMAANSTGAPVEFMSTHPSDAKRIAKLKEFLPEAMKYYKK